MLEKKKWNWKIGVLFVLVGSIFIIPKKYDKIIFSKQILYLSENSRFTSYHILKLVYNNMAFNDKSDCNNNLFRNESVLLFQVIMSYEVFLRFLI